MRRDILEVSGDGLRPTPEAALLVSCSSCSALHRPENALAFHPVCEPCRRNGGTTSRSMMPFHALSERAIADVVGETSPGTYVLGYLDGSDFAAYYVGRSDSDVNASLHTWVGAPSRARSYAPSPNAPWRSRSGPLPGLGTRALGHIAVGPASGYTHFAFCYADSAIAAFERQCRSYHALGGSECLDNRRHPQPPPDSPWACPVHGGPVGMGS